MSRLRFGWLISREYLAYERQEMAICDILKQLGTPYQLVSNTQDPLWELEPVDGIMVLGGIRFVREALRCNQFSSQQLKQPLMPMFGSDLHALHSYLFKIPQHDRLNRHMQLKTLFQLREEPLPEQPVFIKPDHSLKSMDAMVVSPPLWSEWFALAARRQLQPGSLFWLSPVIAIQDEFRVALSQHDGIVSSSCYMHNGEPADSEEAMTSPELTELDRIIQGVLQNWQFDDAMIMLDIARTSMGIKVVECNAVSSSGWYGLSLPAMIEAVHQCLALQIAQDA